MSFSLKSIANALQNAIQRAITGIQTPGGYLSPKLGGLASIGTAIGGLLGATFPERGGMVPAQLTRAETLQPTGYTQTYTPVITTPTIKTTTPTNTTTTKTSGAGASTPAAPTQKSTVIQQGQAPVSGTTTPPPQTQPSTAKTGVVTTPPPSSGYMAPLPSALPPTPVMPGETTQPTTPENLARYEAMIRALQELAGGARYVPMPAIGAEPFGPAGALERALRRLREREVRV